MLIVGCVFLGGGTAMLQARIAENGGGKGGTLTLTEPLGCSHEIQGAAAAMIMSHAYVA